MWTFFGKFGVPAHANPSHVNSSLVGNRRSSEEEERGRATCWGQKGEDRSVLVACGKMWPPPSWHWRIIMPGMLAAKGTESSCRELLAVGWETFEATTGAWLWSGLRDCGKLSRGGCHAPGPQDSRHSCPSKSPQGPEGPDPDSSGPQSPSSSEKSALRKEPRTWSPLCQSLTVEPQTRHFVLSLCFLICSEHHLAHWSWSVRRVHHQVRKTNTVY